MIYSAVKCMIDVILLSLLSTDIAKLIMPSNEVWPEHMHFCLCTTAVMSMWLLPGSQTPDQPDNTPRWPDLSGVLDSIRTGSWTINKSRSPSPPTWREELLPESHFLILLLQNKKIEINGGISIVMEIKEIKCVQHTIREALLAAILPENKSTNTVGRKSKQRTQRQGFYWINTTLNGFICLSFDHGTYPIPLRSGRSH